MLKLKNKIEFENNLWIAELDASKFNSSQEKRIRVVTDIASITKGRLGLLEPKTNPYISKGRMRLYNRLLTESAGNPSTPFEFIPVKIQFHHKLFNHKNISFEKFMNYVVRFSHFEDCEHFIDYENRYLLTNTRTLLNVGIKEENIPFNTTEEIKDFKIIVGRVPFKVISHLVRHRAFSFMVESSRNKKYLNEIKFWYPSWWNDELKEYTKDNDEILLIKLMFEIDKWNLKAEEATMELSDRRLVLFAMAGWKQDIFGWDNLFKVRGSKSTMSITNIVVDNIKKLVYENNI